MRRQAWVRRSGNSASRSATRRGSSRKAPPPRARASSMRSTRSQPRSIASRPSFRFQASAAKISATARVAQRMRRRVSRAGATVTKARRLSTVEMRGSAGSTSQPQGWQLQASPLSVADLFAKQVAESGRAWIFTSATLAVGRDFSLYQRELGLADTATGCWESPFDYGTQALLYVPRDLPAPNSREHTEAVVAAALPVLRASGGRAFLLFTTLRALAQARELLAAGLRARRPRVAAARSGRRLQDRAAVALSRARQRRAARQRELLGGRRRAGRRAVGRHHRQAPVRAAR